MKEKVLVVVLLLCFVPVMGLAQQVVYEWKFDNPKSIAEWNTSWKWESGKTSKGTAVWSERYDGSVKLTVSGAPGSIDFWTTLSIDLEWGDEIEVTFSTDKATEPIGHFCLHIGPAKPHGHSQILHVSTLRAGTFTVRQPIYQTSLVKGTPIGIHVAVWPGTITIYLQKIRIIRR